MIKECLYVMLGGGIGAAVRFHITTLLNKNFKIKHWATFWVNVTGCFALGLLLEPLINLGTELQAFIAVGIIGSYTTFSAFEYENIDLIAHEKYLEFLKYSVYSCLFSFIAVACGFWLGKLIFVI